MPDVSAPDSVGSAELPGFSSAAKSLPAWWTYAVAAIAVAALASSVVGWFLPSGSNKYNADQTTKAKTQICAETKSVDQAVVTNTHRVNPGQKDPAGSLAVAANARLALLGGGAYLQDRLDKQPATPADLANAVGALAGTLEQLGIGYLAEAPEDAQQPLRKTLTTQIAEVSKLCQ
jgi:hypothetical protein